MPLENVVKGLSLGLGEQVDEQPFGNDWILHNPDIGFTLLWSEDEGYAFRQSDSLASLSKQGIVYSAQISETAMCSDAVGFDGGREVWRVDAGDLEKYDAVRRHDSWV